MDRYDGIHGMVPWEHMSEAAQRWRRFYAITPNAPLIQREFGYYSLDRWYNEGLPRDVDLHSYFNFDPIGNHILNGLGWCEAGFAPVFDTVVVEDRGNYELEQDFAGRKVLYFKGRRSGFMPEYVDHPVKDMDTWNNLCKWRMNPETPSRWADFEERMAKAKAAAAEGKVMVQGIVGGYMYLRALMGPEDLLYKFHDDPELIHACMHQWFDLADYVIARHQQHITLDEVFIGEDICYNHGPLISPDMIRTFLFPYYKKILDNAKARQLDPDRKLHFQVDTDGWCVPVIDLYREIGMTFMSPFEVASGCDVVAIGKQYPDLIMSGGIDKRMLAKPLPEMEAYLHSVLAPMKARGGFTPTSDHGVPMEVSYTNFLRYREIMREYA